MSLFDGLSDMVSGVTDFLQENPLVGTIATTALTGYALYKVNQSIRSDQAQTAIANTPTTYSSISPSGGGTTTSPATTNTAGTTSNSSVSTDKPDPGTLIQVPPNQDEKIPVVYGRATVAGIITEAVQKDDNKKMVYVITISEKTGNLMSSDFATPSTFKFNRVYLNGQRIVFKADGITANYTTDRTGNVNKNAKDLVKVWCYAGNSSSQVAPGSVYTISPVTAYSLVPNWTSSKNMTDLVFAVIEITYNKEKGMTDIPVFHFEITNDLDQPGDALCDYMTNTRYGCSILLEDILVV